MPLIDAPMDESTPALVAALKARFAVTEAGLLRDTASDGAPVWAASTPVFDRLFTELEAVLDQTLGRRLAHAAAESEEHRWGRAPALPTAWFGQQRKRIGAVNADWAARGLGQLDGLESGTEGDTLLVVNRPHTALAAGMANAAWECIEGRRFRFQWSDRGAGETVIELTEDPRSIPSHKAMVPDWAANPAGPVEADTVLDRARGEAAGLWTVEGHRTFLLQRDLILRFESLVLPHLADTIRDTDVRTQWAGVSDPERVVFWDGLAEAARLQFMAAQELVLVAEPGHWPGVARQHLAKHGLGSVVNATGIDDHGGVELTLPATFHPALVTGRLLACWERAEGRAGKATWQRLGEAQKITLESRRTIAE